MKYKSIFVIASLIISIPILSFVGAASASTRDICMKHGNMRGHHPGATADMPFGGRMFRMIETLDLSATQREEIWGILDKARIQMRPHTLAMFEGRKQLREVISGDYNQDEVRGLANNQAKTMAELIILRTESRYRIHAVLTTEQRSRFKALRGLGCEGFQQQSTRKPMSLETAISLHRSNKNACSC